MENLEVKCVVYCMIERFGKDSQIDVCIEEMSELTKALIKERRSQLYNREKCFSETSKENIKEELADVLFMFEYLKHIFEFSDEELESIIYEKAKRTESRYLMSQAYENRCLLCGKELPEGYGHVCSECLKNEEK